MCMYKHKQECFACVITNINQACGCRTYSFFCLWSWYVCVCVCMCVRTCVRVCMCAHACMYVCPPSRLVITRFVTGPEKTGLIYTKYTDSFCGTYLIFCMWYAKSVSCIGFLMECCIYDEIVATILITDKKLLHFEPIKLGQILCVDKTCFLRPGHICSYSSIRV